MEIKLTKDSHEIPGVKEYIFDDDVIDPKNIPLIRSTAEKKLDKIKKGDRLTVYIKDVSIPLTKVMLKHCDILSVSVAALNIAVAEIINICHEKGVRLTLMHFDTSTGKYFTQKI